MNNLGSAGTLEVFVRAPIQPEFVDLVADARAAIASALGEALDSLYLYGSVARGCARAGFSDLDLTVVLVRSLSGQESARLEQLRQVFSMDTAALMLEPVAPAVEMGRVQHLLQSAQVEIDLHDFCVT